jgi:alpha-1,2-mannosyltransferase
MTPRGRVLLAAASLAIAAGFVGLAAFTAAEGRRTDVVGYVIGGRAVLEGRSAYHEAETREGWPAGNVYPPVFNAAMVPLAALDGVSPPAARAAWQAANVLALAWAVVLVAGLAHGRRVTLSPRGDGLLLASPRLLVPLVLAYEGVTGAFSNGNVSLILFALALQGLAWQARGKPALGGLALGAAAACKLIPVLFLPYLAWRRRHAAAAWTLAWFVALSVAPAALSGWGAYVDDVRAWLDATGQGWESGWMNQSVPATWDRFLGHGVVPFVTAATPLAASGSAAVTAAVWATRAAVAGLALALFRGPMRPDGRLALTEWSVVFIVGAVLGPITWKHYLAVLLLPYALLASVLLDRRCSPGSRRVAAGLLVAAFLLTVVSTRDVVGRATARHLQMAGIHAIACVVLLAGLFVLRRRLAREPETPPGAGASPAPVPAPAAAAP